MAKFGWCSGYNPRHDCPGTITLSQTGEPIICSCDCHGGGEA